MFWNATMPIWLAALFSLLLMLLIAYFILLNLHKERLLEEQQAMTEGARQTINQQNKAITSYSTEAIKLRKEQENLQEALDRHIEREMTLVNRIRPLEAENRQYAETVVELNEEIRLLKQPAPTVPSRPQPRKKAASE